MDSSPELTAIDRCTEKLVYVIRIDPLSIALKLISKELLPHSIADRMRLPGITEEVKATDLVASVRRLIAECPEKFNDFVKILKEESWLNSVSETLSSTYSECLQQLMTTPERDDPNVSTNEAPGDDITSPDLSVQEKITVLKTRFQKLIKNAVSYFVNQQAKDPGFLDSFRLDVAFLLDLQQLLPSTFSIESILEAKSVALILAKFSKFWDYMNCSLLDKIVSNFGDSTLKKEMAMYMKDLQTFCSNTNVFNFPAWEGNIPPDFSKVVAMLNISAHQCTVAHLLEYCQKIAYASVLQPKATRYSSSVIVTLSFPRVLTSLFVKTYDKKSKSAKDIKQLVIDGVQLEDYQHLLKDPFPLIVAAQRGYTEVTKTLIASESDVNIQNEDGDTPLSLASKNGHLSTVQVMVEAGADVTIPDNSGATPLWCACSEGHTAIAALLIDHGANLNRPRADDVGNPPLVQTSARGHLDTVKLLIDRGATVDGQNKTGTTPLIAANQEGHKDIVEVLLNHGAEVDLPRKDGNTPLIAASQEGRKDIVEVLLNHGADFCMCVWKRV